MGLVFRTMLCLQYCLLLFFHFSSSFSSSSLQYYSSRPPFFSCQPDQSSALLHFKNSLHFGELTWENGTDCCLWEGVTCNSMSGHVIGLDLSWHGLGGEIHPNNTLLRLTHLQTLNLAFNNFNGSQLPSQIGGFVSLTHLNLSSCDFEGEIPSQISHLSKLVSIDLSQPSYAIGDLQWKGTTWKKLLQNATGLTEIILDSTDMSSISPSPLYSLLKCSSSSSLVTLSLAGTGIEGDLTSDNNILCLPNLQDLSLGGIQVHVPDQLNCRSSLSVLDLSWCSLQGLVPSSSFANLTNLTSLILSGNDLNGSIPQFLSNLQHLTHLDLSHNELSGPIPSSLSNLHHLTYLDLSNNQLSGQVPELFNELTKLQTLFLYSNNLGGQLPSSLFALTQLSSLDCSFNHFEGPLPNIIPGFSILTDLYLSDNKLNESLPSWCLSLPYLTSLDIANNQFTGHIGAISSSSLEHLDLCDNKLQGDIPESIFNLANLTYLCLSSNNSTSPLHFPLFSKFRNLAFLTLSGYGSLSLKSEINVSYSFPSLWALHLLSNNLTDYAEAAVQFSNLFVLKISNNNLQGKVPNLSSNLMAGDIPSFICNATSLEIVNLSDNNFTGTFPQCFANFSDLLVLDLQMNNLHGTLPNTFSMNRNLQTLNLNGNQFEGPLPKSLSNCTYLEDLNLGNNKIEDSFPNWLENLQDLEILVLRGNKFYGPIVSSLVKKHPSFPNLIFFDISYNNFSGPLPEAYIKNFQAMKSDLQAGSSTIVEYMKPDIVFGYGRKSVIEYVNSLVATIKGVSTPYVKIPRVFVNIDLSVNNFEGEIPNVIGELQGLIGLNLSHNSLFGPIPRSMGNLTNLESLDLSSNNLTGRIPIELANLNFLEFLNLSQNHLEGPIPKGKQFATFSNESYEGNAGLCGFPLTIRCNNGPESPSSHASEMEDEKFGFGWKPVAIGYGCGMVFGVSLGCLVFFIGKPIWLVSMLGGSGPSKRVSRRTRTYHGNRARMN